MGSVVCYSLSAMEFQYALVHPFVMVLGGPTQSGKSTLIKEMIERMDDIICPSIQRVIYCYCEDEPWFANNLRDKFKSVGRASIEFQQVKDLQVEEGNKILTLAILDDFMEEIGQSN